MSYPGNPSLSDDIRQRVYQTFDQTLSLAESGKVQEAMLGCDFILRLDGDFSPALDLRERLQGADGAVEVGDLRTAAKPDDGATAPATPEDAPAGAQPSPPSEPEAAAAGGGDDDFATELRELLEQREFRKLLNLAKEYGEQVRTDPALMELVNTAQGRFEAEPYVRSFLESAAKLRIEGRTEEAEATLEKARELDPTHPELGTGEATPDAPPPASAAGEEAPPANDEEKIERLLAEGQEALDTGDLQAAIDAWSRIFLIDIDHAEANERIEQARTLKAEQEREVEELFHEGLAHQEDGATEEARRAFEKVLELSPHHLGAREQLERLEDGGAPGDGPAPLPSPPADDQPEPEAAPASGTEPPSEPAIESEPPPRTTPHRAPPTAPTAQKRSLLSSLTSPRFLAIGGAVLVVVLAAAWFLYSKRDGLFPNSSQPAAAAGSRGPLARAKASHEKGDTAKAIAMLRNLPESHPSHAEAQTLIAQWETLVSESDTRADAPPSSQELERQRDLIAAGRAAARDGTYLRATEALAEANSIVPLDGEDLELFERSRQEIIGLEKPLSLFRQGDWEFALPDLWKIHQADPDDADVRRLMVDSYYNLGVRNLQRSDVEKASEMFSDAAALASDDSELDRLVRFAEIYADRPIDLRYRIFVKYLTFR